MLGKNLSKIQFRYLIFVILFILAVLLYIHLLNSPFKITQQGQAQNQNQTQLKQPQHVEKRHVAKDGNSREEVFQIGQNVYRYMEAIEACKKLGGRLATKEELMSALKKGANWCNLGWVEGIEAYYPVQNDGQKNCGKVGKKGLNGGRIPSQVKLAATCYGVKPSQIANKERNLHILPFNARKWYST